MRSVAVVVQACPAPGRPGLERVRASIEASDIGTNYQLLFQPPELNIREHFSDAWRRGAATGADLILRLEDDVEVNRHILYNLATWEAVDDQRFGVGWAFDPGGMTRTTFDRRWGHSPRKDRWFNHSLAYSQAVVLRAQDVDWVLAGCQRWFSQHPNSPCEQDTALSEAVAAAGKYVAIHAPSLTEHLIDMPSQLGHKHRFDKNSAAQSAGTFAVNWRRGDPIIDRHGRLVTRR